MSIVGTRPPTLDEWNKYELHHRARLAIKPGITGPEFYRKCLNVTKQRALVALKVPTTRSNKIRAILMRVSEDLASTERN